MKITFNKLFFYLFASVWIALIAVNLLIPEKSFSENENRTLKSIPDFSYETLLNGEYMLNVDEYFNDQFIGRDTWITAQSVMEYSLGKRENNGVFIAKNGALMDNVAEPNEKYVQQNINGINYFSSKYDMDCFVMIIPSAACVQREMLPYTASVWDQQAWIREVYGQLEGVRAIDLYSTLYEHRQEYIYYRTDHHWTTYGASLALEKYCGDSGFPLPADMEYVRVSDAFHGTLYSRSGVRFIKSDQIDAVNTESAARFFVYTGAEMLEYDSIYFDEFLDKKDKYSYFLGTSQPVVTIQGGAADKKLLIFKDSYSHCFAPMLLEYFSEITLVDLRYLGQNLDDIIPVEEYDQALFLFSVDVFGNQNNLVKLKMFS